MAHILAVEDDSATRLLFAAVLRRHYLECTVAPDGEAALDALKRDRFDAVLLDLRLPGIDGFDILREMERTTPDLVSRVVVCTAMSLWRICELPQLRRVAALISKPADIRTPAVAVLGAAGPAPHSRGGSDWMGTLPRLRG